MSTAATDSRTRFDYLREYFNSVASKKTEAQLGTANDSEENQTEAFLGLMHKQPYYQVIDFAEIDEVNPIEKALAHLFMKYRDFNKNIESIYRSLITSVEERFGFKLDHSSTSKISTNLKTLTVTDWLDSIIRNQPTKIKKLEKLENKFQIIRDTLGINLPFFKGSINESRAELALAAIEMEQRIPIKIRFRPNHKSSQKLEEYVQNSMGLLNGVIRRIKRRELPFKSEPDLKQLQDQLNPIDKTKPRLITLEHAGVDFLIQYIDIEDPTTPSYLPIQVKSSQIAADKFPSQETTFTFDQDSFDYLKTQVTNPIINNANAPRIRFSRNIPCIAVNDKTIEQLKIEIESLLKSSKKLELEQAYQARFSNGSITNINFVAAMINQGFLVPIREAW